MAKERHNHKKTSLASLL